MEMEDEKYNQELKDILEEAKEIKKILNLESIDTALLIMIHQGVDLIRYHNSE